MNTTPVPQYSRLLLTFHHILSTQKKRTIRQTARELELYGICKVGYPGVLAVEGEQENVSRYLRDIKALRWASCTLANHTASLSTSDLRMFPSRHTYRTELAHPPPPPGVDMVEKMSEVGAYMRRVGLEKWWRRSMGYQKGGLDSS